MLFLKWEWILYFRVAFGLSYCFRDVFGMCSGCVRDVFGTQVFVENKQDRCLFTKLKKCIFPLLSLLQNLPLAYYVATQQSKNVLLLCFRCSKICLWLIMSRLNRVKMYCYSAFAAPKFAFGLLCRDSTGKNVLLLCFRCSKIWYSARIALSLHKI